MNQAGTKPAGFDEWAGIRYRNVESYTSRDHTHGLEAWSAALDEATALLPSIMTETFKRQDCTDEFLNGMAYGAAQYCSAIKTLADPGGANLLAKHRWPAVQDAPKSAGAPETSRSGEKVQAEQDAREIAEIWDAATVNAAMYVETHCVDGEMHAKAIMSATRPRIYITDGDPVNLPALKPRAVSATLAEEILATVLWLYRRLPRGYGRPPTVERPILALAEQVDIDVEAYLADRGPIRNEN